MPWHLPHWHWSPNKVGVLFVGAATLPLIAMSLSWLGPYAAALVSSGPAKGAPLEAGMQGHSRNELLAKLTRSYVARGEAGVTAGMAAGRELAPTAFLNQELKQRGEKWRVETTAGMDADTYDVS